MPWGPCSASCLGGIQFRSRNYKQELHGGKPCAGDAAQSRVCNNETCKFLKEDTVWGVVVKDTDNWSLEKMSKCCCDISPSYYAVFKKNIYSIHLKLYINTFTVNT